MRIPLPLVALVAGLAACAGDNNEPTPIGDLDLAIEPRTIDLGTYTYEDRVFTPQSYLFQNNSPETLFVINGLPDAEGDGAALLVSDFLPFSRVLPDQSRPINISLDPRTWRWSTGTYSVKVPLEVSYFFSPSSGIFSIVQPQQRIKDVTAGDARLTVNFEIDCDLDGDGFDAIACSGMDCNDDNADIAPDAEEDCITAADDDCDGSSNDPDALNSTLYFADNDGDGYGDDDDTVTACRRPATGTWSLRGGDCNDDEALEDPGRSLELRCSDGLDNDCNGLVDDADPACGG